MMYSACSPRNKVFLGNARLRTLVYKPHHDLKKGTRHILLDQAGRGKGTVVSLFSPINLSTHSMDVSEMRFSLRAKFWFRLLLQSVIQIWWRLCGCDQISPQQFSFLLFQNAKIFFFAVISISLYLFFFFRSEICLKEKTSKKHHHTGHSFSIALEAPMESC